MTSLFATPYLACASPGRSVRDVELRSGFVFVSRCPPPPEGWRGVARWGSEPPSMHPWRNWVWVVGRAGSPMHRPPAVGLTFRVYVGPWPCATWSRRERAVAGQRMPAPPTAATDPRCAVPVHEPRPCTYVSSTMFCPPNGADPPPAWITIRLTPPSRQQTDGRAPPSYSCRRVRQWNECYRGWPAMRPPAHGPTPSSLCPPAPPRARPLTCFLSTPSC